LVAAIVRKSTTLVVVELYQKHKFQSRVSINCLSRQMHQKKEI
jgi:hypothetical protein